MYLCGHLYAFPKGTHLQVECCIPESVCEYVQQIPQVIFQRSCTELDPTRLSGGFRSSHPPRQLVHVSLPLSHSGGYVVGWFYASTCTSLITNDVEHIFFCLLASFAKCLFRSCANFLIRLFVFSLSIYRSSTYIWNSSPLLEMCIVNIFST